MPLPAAVITSVKSHPGAAAVTVAMGALWGSSLYRFMIYSAAFGTAGQLIWPSPFWAGFAHTRAGTAQSVNCADLPEAIV